MELDSYYKKLGNKKQVFITGAYRSGTTLLHHLLDGHPNLLVMPVENSLFRDYLFYESLPNPKKRNLNKLKPYLNEKNVDALLSFVFSHEKLGLPLSRSIALTGSMGDQRIETHFCKEKFAYYFRKDLETHLEKSAFDIKDLFNAYNKAYFLNLIDSPSKADNIHYLVNKCPEKGICIPYYLDNFPEAKILHIIRDPRDVVASHKGKLTRGGYLAYRKFFNCIQVSSDSLKNFSRFSNHPQVCCLQYEKLVQTPEAELSRVANFLDIPYTESLLTPTILGKLWNSNSSDQSQRQQASIYTSSTKGYKKKLTLLEIQCIEKICLSPNNRLLNYKTTTKQSKFLHLKYWLVSRLSVRSFFMRLKRYIKYKQNKGWPTHDI